MTRFLRLLTVLPLLAPAAPGATAATFAENLGARADEWWLEAAPKVSVDPWRQELTATRAGRPAEVSYQFRSTAQAASLSVSYAVRFESAGSLVRWQAGRDGRWVTVAEHTWRGGPQTVRLDDQLDPDRPVTVKLTILAAERPGAAGVSRIRWTADQVVRVPPTAPRPPLSAWLYPAWAAAQAGAEAVGLPPGVELVAGAGRAAGPLTAPWLPLAAPDTWRAERVPLPAAHRSRCRLLVAPTGPGGGRIAINGVELACHRLPGMPLAAVLDAPGVPPVEPPDLELSGVLDPALVRLVETGPLELRHLRQRVEWSSPVRLWAEATVVNHTGGDLSGSLRGRVTAPDGGLADVAAGGYLFPPGASLARLAFTIDRPARWSCGHPAEYAIAASVDDGAAVSDATTVMVGFKEVASESGRWRLNGAVLSVVGSEAGRWREALAEAGRAGAALAAPAPLEEALLAEAERLGVPVIVQAEGIAERAAYALLYDGCPAVLGVAPLAAVRP